MLICWQFSGCPLASHSACAHIWSDAGPSPMCRCIFQPRWIPARGFLGGWQDILGAGAEPPGSLLYICGLGGLLDHKNDKNVVSLSFIQAEPCSCRYLYLECQQETAAAQPGAQLSPASLLLSSPTFYILGWKSPSVMQCQLGKSASRKTMLSAWI